MLSILKSLGAVIACSTACVLGAAAAWAQTSIAAPTSQTLIDAQGHVWSFGAAGGYGYAILRDGVQFSNGSGLSLTYTNGVIWTRNNLNSWYAVVDTGWAQQSMGPTSTVTSTSAIPTNQMSQSLGPSACADFSAPLPALSYSANALGEEFVGPFASWADLKRDYGAIGDGATDDTRAIQSALNDLSTAAGKSPVLFIPSGTYLITQTVTVMAAQGIGVIGEDPSTTILKWVGANEGTLLHINGISYSRLDRLTFDGNGSAGVLVDQSVTDYNEGRQFDTGNQYADDVFKNASIGIQGGQYDRGAAESSVLRSKFLNLSGAGIILLNFNALDWWVWYSSFQNNGIAITNKRLGANATGGAGNFHAFNNVFRASTWADFWILNTGNFNFRDNFSINSGKFLNEQFYYTNAAVTRLQGNTIITPPDNGHNGCNGCSIVQGNMGPLIMTDNTFVSPPNATAAAVVMVAQDPPDCVSVGNTYTQKDTVRCSSFHNGSGRLISQDDQVVPAASINQTPPTLPGVPPNRNRKIFDVAVGSGASDIQQAILQATAYCGQRPIIHLSYGTYEIAKTVTVPANCDMQLVGDGGRTALIWKGSGPGPAIVLQGPSRAILREFYLNAGSAIGIEVRNADQQKSRIYMEEISVLRSTAENIFVDSLDYTLVELHDFQLAYTAISPASAGIGLKVVGGPLAQQGRPQSGRTNLLAGSHATNYLSYQASQGASLIVRDAWYESNSASTYALVSGNSTVTFEGSRISNSGGVGGLAVSTSADAVQVDNFSCTATILSSAPDSDIRVNGTVNGNIWALGNNFGTASNYATNLSGSAEAAFNLNRYYVPAFGSKPIADLTAVPDPNFIRKALAQSRSTHPSKIEDLVAAVTDVRFYRVTVELGSIGVHLAR